MNNKIRHSGVIANIDGSRLQVKILQTSACMSCKVSKHCNTSEQKIKTVDVYDLSAAGRYHVGDEVVVAASLGTGYRAVLLGFVIPFIILITSLIIATRVTADEALAALISLSALIPYYIILYCCRGNLQRKFSFYIE